MDFSIFNICFIVTIMLGYVKHYQKVITISNCGNTILYFKTVNDTIPSYAKINFKNVCFIVYKCYKKYC